MGRPTSLWVVRNTESRVMCAFSIERELREWLDNLPADKLVEVVKVRNGEPDVEPIVLNPRTLKPVI